MHADTLQDMVEEQIIASGITDPRVIEAFYSVDRRLFVPPDLFSYAYNDSALSIGYNQAISQPYIVAFMTYSAKLNSECKVLEIGTGCGYQAAILSKLCKEVYTIEIIEPLGKEAEIRLKNLGYNNVHLRIGDGYKGWPEQAPFDAIIVTAAPESIPDTLIKQLKIGGRMIVPIGKFEQELERITRYEDKIVAEMLEPVRFVPMIHEKE